MQKKRSKAPIIVEIIFTILLMALLAVGIIFLWKSISKENSALTVEGDKTTVVETASEASDYIDEHKAALNLSDDDSLEWLATVSNDEYNYYVFCRSLSSDCVILERTAVVTNKANNTVQYLVAEFGEDRVSSYDIETSISIATGYIQYAAITDEQQVNLVNKTFELSYDIDDYYYGRGVCIAYYDDSEDSYEMAVLITAIADTKMYWLICDTNGQEVMYSGTVDLGFDVDIISSVSDDTFSEAYGEAYGDIFKNLYGTGWSEFFTYAQSGYCTTTIIWIVETAVSAFAIIIVLICLIVTCVKYNKAGAEISEEQESASSDVNNEDWGEWNEDDTFGGGDMNFLSAGCIEFQCREYLDDKIYVKEGEEVRMGKDPKRADFVVPIQYKHVSRLHCMVTYSGLDNHFYITDYSSNGTYVNDRKIPKNTPIRLDDYTKVALSKDGFEFIVNN